MWEFLSEMLAKGGVVAVLFTLVLIGVGLGFRWMATRLRKAELAAETCDARVAAIRAEEGLKRSKMRGAFDDQLHRLTLSHTEEILAVREDQRADQQTFAAQLHELQERRVEEGRAIVREVVTQTAATETAMAKLADQLERTRR